MTNTESDKPRPPSCEVCGTQGLLYVIRRDVLHVTKHSWGTQERYDWFMCPDCRDAHNLKRLENEIKQLKEQHDRQL